VIGTEFTAISVTCGIVTLPLLKFVILLSLISELMMTCLNDRMANTHNRMGDPEPAHSNWNPPLPSTLAQAIASILVSRDEQTKLLR
jgi:hypothetical protein